MPRNPVWARDELILALDLYFRVNPIHTSEINPEIQELSRVLNELPIHTNRPEGDRFRNPNGVYMKLCNFLRFDPDYTGTGLTRGGRLEKEIWEEFAGHREVLSATARAIRESRATLSLQQVEAEVPAPEDEFAEGRLLTALHKRRERSVSAVRRKKASVLAATRRLACEACGFDFGDFYGPLGQGFAECHHTVALSELTHTGSTRLADLALICANCHRMIHRSRPMLTVAQLRQQIRDQESTSNNGVQTDNPTSSR
jgi:5-methylcytosine-specific restriction protein A